MSVSIGQFRKLPLNRAVSSILEQFSNTSNSTAGLRRIEVPLEPVDLIGWLSNQSLNEKFYWSDRNKTFEVAGLGACVKWQGATPELQASAFQDIDTVLSNSSPAVKIFGGLLFDEFTDDVAWGKFGQYYFLLPQIEVIRRDEEYFLALNVRSGQESLIRSFLERVETETHFRRGTIPQLLSRTDLPGKHTFIQNVADVTKRIQQQEIRKAVLARKTIFQFDAALNCIEIFHRLVEQTPNCFHFFIQPAADVVFLGASPERLYRREGQRLKTEALAGTRSRGLSKEHDNLLKKELLNSVKDRHEHEIVVEDITASLSGLAEGIDHDETCSLMTLKGGHHLITRVQADLRSSVRDSDLLQTLHPTSAVAGTPTQNALEIISRLEPFSRGFYAAPVGFFSKKESEFCVAIRSGLIDNDSVSLFSGAGIVADSDPISEWEEIENKMGTFLRALND